MPEFRRKNLGQKMIESELITQEQYETAMEKHAQTQVSLRQVLVDMGIVNEQKMMDFVGKSFDIPVYRELFGKIENPDIISIIPEKICRQHTVIPLQKKNNVLTVAMVDPLDVFVLDDLEKIAECKVQPVLSTRTEILNTLQIFYEEEGGGLEKLVKDMAKEEKDDLEVIDENKGDEPLKEGEVGIVDAPVIRLVNTIISQAIKERASDVHVEPDDKSLRIRYRVDGILRETMSPPKRLQAPITSRIKIMAGMDISIKRAPQDGRFRLRADNGGDFDVRISTVPTIYGEKVVMRLLDQTSIKIGLADSGVSKEGLQLFKEMIERPYGIILVTGPTGSGKTTTLYLALQMINSPDKNIITIEEPVEYDLEGINQIAVNVKAGVTFANGLKSILRQDPDVIMVGEMRDLETADIAVRAALTGHLVFSTLHTNDAPSAVARMVDMGVPPYLVTSSVCCILAQRLVRTLCPQCKEAYKPSEKELEEAKMKDRDVDPLFYRGKGCSECNDSGFFGRVGLFELMVVDKELRNLIHSGKSTDVIREAAQKAGMKTLWEDGIDKVLKGVTTFEEIKRVTFVEQD